MYAFNTCSCWSLCVLLCKTCMLRDNSTLRGGKAGQELPTWDVKATENSKMQAEMMDNVSCAQKLNHPMRLQASDALARAFLATSETAGLVLRGSSSEVDFAFVIGACEPLTPPERFLMYFLCA